MRIDERTAGFLALGLALRSGRPVPVVTTSGTAVANLHPSVLEASHAGVPLLVLTADRPPQLVGTGANQTVVQPGIFGDAVRLALTTAPASDPEREHGPWRAAVARALAAALGTPPGPVHLNLPFANRWCPTPGPLRRAGPEGPRGPRCRGRGSTRTRCRSTRRRPPWWSPEPAPRRRYAGWGLPVIAEPASGVWDVGLRSGPWLLGALPDAPPARPRSSSPAVRPCTGPCSGCCADPRVAVYALADPAGPRWTDVAGAGRAVGAAPSWNPGPDWTARWLDADRAAGKALDAALDDAGAPGGLRLARALVDALPGGALLVVGSSNPIRDVSLAAAPRGDVTVLANRGVAGIDGTVSTAVGAALAHAGTGVRAARRPDPAARHHGFWSSARTSRART